VDGLQPSSTPLDTPRPTPLLAGRRLVLPNFRASGFKVENRTAAQKMWILELNEINEIQCMVILEFIMTAWGRLPMARPVGMTRNGRLQGIEYN
jgi:hypothetical protein